MDTPTLIIGHQNPDADAICSAIAYAAFKKALGFTHHQPARCGNSNARIDAILNHCQVPLPPFVGDVTPRVRDIMISDVRKVNLHATCAEALELIDQYDVRALPVVDDEDRVQGQVTIFDLGEFFIPKPREPKAMRRVFTSVQDIVRALKAEVLLQFEPERTEELYVRVGAMDIRSFGKFASEEGVAPSQSVIVVGDRYDIQQKAIQLGVRMLVITGGLDIDEQVVEMARERGICLIISPYDSATSSWFIRTASRMQPMMDTEMVTFSPDEKLSAVRRRLLHATYSPIYLVMDEHQKLLGIFTKTDLLKPIKTRIILVDHNELTQAVNGAAEVNIVEVIDHHRLGNQPTHQPILFHNEPVGSTCTIVADLFRRHGIKPEPAIAGVMMGGVISDTLNLQSPTTTPKDHDILAWLSKQADIAPDDFARHIFSSGSVVLSSSPEKVILSDCKAYEEADVSFSVSQIEELGFDNFWQKADALQKALAEHRRAEGHYFSCLLVTDINTQNSLLVVDGAPDFMEQITYPPLAHDDIFDLPGIVSRKKQLIPYLTSLLTGAGVTEKG